MNLRCSWINCNCSYCCYYQVLTWTLCFGRIMNSQGKTVFTHLAITPPKVNWFGWNLEHTEYIVGGWPLQILGAICAVATVCEAAKILTGK